MCLNPPATWAGSRAGPPVSECVSHSVTHRTCVFDSRQATEVSTQKQQFLGTYTRIGRKLNNDLTSYDVSY